MKVVAYADIAPFLARLLRVPHIMVALPGGDDAHIARLLADAHVLVSPRYKAAWRDSSGTSLRLVHATGAGIDAIELKGLPAGCAVCNVYGHARGVTEQAVMLMLALQKRVFAFDAALRRGDWTLQQAYTAELRGRNLLVLGLGHIGRELVRWGRFMEMNVTALTRSPAKVRDAAVGPLAVGGLDQLDSHLAAADFVVVAIPAAAETTDLIDERRLRLLKPSAFIVNVGRAAVINEKALYEALRSRRIAGAGLDVWYQYPSAFWSQDPGAAQTALPGRFPFHELDNVIMTPHKTTAETMDYRYKEIAANLERFARGEPLRNQVWP
jgi:phosphoglycerate dehydrogenase-like enzyme